jgi:acetyltransferase-like isoleucine patch superfamily enzyme
MVAPIENREDGLMGDVGRLARHALRRVKRGVLMDALVGPDVAELRRLKKAGRVIMGNHAYGEPRIFTFPYDDTKLYIGPYSGVGANLLLGGQHGVRTVTTYAHRIYWGMEGAGEDGIPVRRGDLVVGADCWVTFGAWVLSGITIGDGAVVATGAVVTKDVPPYAIVGGNPARIIGWRHTEEQREALLEIKWWDWPDDEVRAAVPYLASEDIDAFIEYARSMRSPAASPSAEQRTG